MLLKEYFTQDKYRNLLFPDNEAITLTDPPTTQELDFWTRDYSSAFYDYFDHAFENAKRNKKKSSSDVSKESNDSIELLKSLGILPTTFDDTTLCEIRDHQFVDNFKTIIENLVLPFFASSMKRILFGEGHRLGFNHSLGICEVKHWDDVFDDSTCTNNSTNRSCSIHTEQNGNSPLFTSISSSAKAYHVEQMRQEMSESLKRKIEYGEVPKSIVEAQNRALANRVGIWSLHEEKKEEVFQPLVKSKAETVTVRLSEIRSGGHFFFQVVGDDAASVIDKSMKEFTAHNGTDGAPCDLKVGKVVAAALDDGSGKSWYRAKITERKARHVKVLFVDHRNISTVPIATHLRPLDPQLGVVRIPPVAKEATLALTKTRSLDDDEGIEAARLLQTFAWGRDVSATIYCKDDGKLVVSLFDANNTVTVNEQLVSEGLARVSKANEVEALGSNMVNIASLLSLNAELRSAEQIARRTHSGMWRYGDVGGDDDDDEQ